MAFKVRDKVEVLNSEGNKIADGVIYNINDFREPSMKYAVDVEGFSDFVFVGEQNLKKKEEKLEKITVDCLYRKDDKMIIDYADKMFGFDVITSSGEKGILVTIADAEEIYEFLKAHLGK